MLEGRALSRPKDNGHDGAWPSKPEGRAQFTPTQFVGLTCATNWSRRSVTLHAGGTCSVTSEGQRPRWSVALQTGGTCTVYPDAICRAHVRNELVTTECDPPCWRDVLCHVRRTTATMERGPPSWRDVHSLPRRALSGYVLMDWSRRSVALQSRSIENAYRCRGCALIT